MSITKLGSSSVCRWVIPLLAIAIGWSQASIARGYTPDDPKVKGMVDKGVKFLQSADHNGLGINCLLALAMIKADEKNKTAQLVQDAIKRCQDSALNPRFGGQEKGVYELSVAIVLLCELGPREHQPTIQALLAELYQLQNQAGWWSYPTRKIGDTSVTQYGMLALWSADQANRREKEQLLDIRPGAAERACNWLMRTQDPGGAWSYLGEDPGENNYNRIPQNREVTINAGRITPSMVVGGLGSVYMGADILRIEGHVEKRKTATESKALLKKVTAPAKDEIVRPSHSVNLGTLRKSIDDGERYYRQNCKTQTQHWQLYYLYGMERFHALHDLATGTKEAEPDWYNRGVDFLAGKQQDDGSWLDALGEPPINTAFALLFLLRSTEKTVAQLLDGRLRGGRILPDDISNLTVDADGAIVRPQIVTELDAVVGRLAETASLDALPTDVKFSEVQTEKKRQLDALAKLFSDEDYVKRAFAVRTVARAGDVEKVPALIFALSDPDPRVVKEASDGLQLISRKLTGFGLANEPTAEQKRDAQEKWKAWYKSVRPDADLEFLK